MPLKITKPELTFMTLTLNNIAAAKTKAGSPPASGAKVAAPARPPRFELDGKKWAIEFQKNNQNLVSFFRAALYNHFLQLTRKDTQPMTTASSG